MQTIIITKGLPASGKSSWAIQYCQEHLEFVRVNKDNIRNEILRGTGEKWSKKVEKEVERIRDEYIRNSLRLEHSVISDDTNFSPRHEVRIRQIADEILGVGNYQFIINDGFCNVPVDECIRRDALRENSVGEKVIVQMWRQFLMPDPVEWTADDIKPKTILVDLDGNLSLFGKGKNPYDRDFENDIINTRLLYIIQTLRQKGVYIIFLSGRLEKYRKQTLRFLDRCGFDDKTLNWTLMMRADGDNRPDDKIKEQIYLNNIEPYYDVMCVFDDRLRVCRMWVRNGLFVFNTNQYNLEY